MGALRDVHHSHHCLQPALDQDYRALCLPDQRWKLGVRMSFLSGPAGASAQPAAPVLPSATPAAPPAFGLAPQGQKPGAKASQPTFLGAGLTAGSGNTGGKTLLGT